jgi:predicted Zn-dependent protease
MKKPLWRLSSFPIFLASNLALTLTVFLLLLSFSLPPKAIALSQQEEIEIGRQVQSQIAAQLAIFDDPITNEYFRKVCARLLKASGKQPFPFHFYIVNSPFLNAFAVPGGYIYLHTETINSLQNQGQLAAILAHEIAHITSRHFSRRQEASKSVSLMNLAGLVAGLVLAGAGGGGQNTAALGQALLIGSTGASIQAMLANSRADEMEADSKGRDYLIKAGYNPRDMYGAFKIMNDQSYQLAGNLPGYLSTHPGLSSRLASTFADQAAAPTASQDEGYMAIRDRVLALTSQTNRSRNEFNKRISANPNDASAIHGLGLVLAREMSYKAAFETMTKALELSPNNHEYQTDLGDLALRRRQPKEAVKYYELARKSAPNDNSNTLGLARAYELTGRTKEASVLYDEVVSSSGDDFPIAFEYAGRFFGQQGQMAKGYFLLSNFYEYSGKLKDSIFHCKQSMAAPGGGIYRARCEKRTKDLEELEKLIKKNS